MKMSEVKRENNLNQNNCKKAVSFILCNVFFERFCSAGISGEL
jgi:hypothetical protein